MADMELQLKLSADGSSLTGELRTASGELRKFSAQADAAGKQADAAGKQAARGMGETEKAGAKMGKAIAVAGVAVASAFAALVVQQTNYAASVGDVSQRTGVSAEKISSLASAARLAGSDFGAVTSALDTFGQNIQRAAGGSRQQAAVFDAMGISVRDAGGHLRDTDVLMAEATRKLAGYKDGSAKTALAQRLFGDSAKDLMPVLNQLGEEGFQGVTDKAAALNQVVSTDMAQAAGQMQVQMRTLREQVNGYALAVAGDLLPAINALVGEWIKSDTAAKGASGSMDGTARSATGVGQAVKDVIGWFIALHSGLQKVGVYLAAFFTSLGTEWDFIKRKFSDTTWLSGLGNVIAGALAVNLQQIAQGRAQMAAAGDDLDKQFATRRAANAMALKGSLDDIDTETTRMFDKLFTTAKDSTDKIKQATDPLGAEDAPIPQFGRNAEAAAGKVAKLTEEQLRQKAVIEAGKEAMATLAEIQSGAVEEIAVLRDRLAGASDAQIEFNKTQRQAAAALKVAQAAMDPNAVKAYNAAMAAAQAKFDVSVELDNAQSSAAALEDVLSRFGEMTAFEKLSSDIGLVDKALESATEPERIERLKRAQAELNKEMGQRNLGLMQDGISMLQRYAKEGTAAYTALGIAQDIMAYKSAVAAVANQGSGDPYSAFFRIAAMIALMASIGIRVGGGGGGGGPSAQSAEVRQASQGTGTVLGDSTAKSESISKAIEITASATSELVGINRGMLRALESLEKALGAAGGLLARGAGDVDFPDPGGGGLFLGLFGESNELIDQGIIIAGGALQDMLNSVVVGAYQTIESNGGFFGSDETYDNLVDVSDQFSQQFSLVIGSLIDTVREGAEALGLLPADIEAAIAAFEVQQIRISLMDLSAEEQQAELEAVFSSIFDGLAGAVVPFIEQFQQVGEGLGETLVRIATEVQVTQEAIAQLGLAVNETDPERFAQIADGLVQAAGGLEDFISGFQSFVSNFATDQHQFTVSATELASALGQVGLAVPATRGEMWELMQSLDATTASGQEQIATLLRLSDVADQYYSALEDQDSGLREIIELISVGSASLSDFGQSLADIYQAGESAVAAANAIAVAQGREGASAVQLARIHQWTADQVAAAMRRLQAETQDLIAQLYGGPAGTLDEINRQISELEQQSGNAIGGIANDSANLFEAWRSGIQSVQDYLDSMLLGDLSALTPEEQLAEARRQLEAAQAAALGGDVDALNSLPQMADAYLRLLREFEASGADYNSGFDWVRDLLQQVTGVAGPAAGAPTTTVQVTASADLQALYAQRDALLAQQEGEHRRILAEQLAQNLHDLAVLLNTPILEMITLQGVSLQQLAADLGINLQDLTASSVQALGDMATTLGTNLAELTGALGLSLTDLSAGLTELTARVGIDLQSLTVESTQTLALLATSLGADLTDLATSLGVSLGALADQQSLLNQALAAEIASLPAEQSAALAPLLEAISAATTEADANTAIQALEDAVNLLAPDIRTQLAPYLADVFPADALSDLDYLSDLQSIATDQLGALLGIQEAIRDSNGAAGVPGYAVGTGYVPNTGLAILHEGEGVFPAHINSWMRQNGYPVSGGSNTAVVAKIEQLIARVDQLDRNNQNGHRETAQVVDRTGMRTDQNAERVAADCGPRSRHAAYGG